MKVLKIIGILFAVLVAIVVVLGIAAPKDFAVQRQTVINASQETVWKGISTFEQFNKWNPWIKKDPKQIVKDEGTDGTVGAKHSWKGNKEVGEGSMTLTKVESNKYVEYDLFFADRNMHNTGYMNMEKAEGGQKVTWGFKAKLSFPWNAIALFMNFDKQAGPDFEKGLAGLKILCEAAPVYKIVDVEWAEKNCLSIRQIVDFKDMAQFFGNNYPKMGEAIGKAGAKQGIPLAVFYKYDEKAMNADVAAAIPFEGKKVLTKGFSNLNLPAAKAFMIDYVGDYNKMKPAYDAMDAKLKILGKENPEMVIEEYVTDPMAEKDTAKWETRIYFFVKN